jgi:DNA-binding response OmpR family regulator
MDMIWGKNYFGDERAIDTLIKRIRKKLQNDSVHFEIASVYGIGYRLEEKHG